MYFILILFDGLSASISPKWLFGIGVGLSHIVNHCYYLFSIHKNQLDSEKGLSKIFFVVLYCVTPLGLMDFDRFGFVKGTNSRLLKFLVWFFLITFFAIWVSHVMFLIRYLGMGGIGINLFNESDMWPSVWIALSSVVFMQLFTIIKTIIYLNIAMRQRSL